MNKEEVQRLLQRYRAGDCTLQEMEQINDWFNNLSDDSLELSEVEKVEVKNRILSTLRPALVSEDKKVKTRKLVVVTARIAAAVIGLLIVAYILFVRTPKIESTSTDQVLSSTQIIEHKNVTQSCVEIKLPDSSTVQLKPGAEISYLRKWTQEKREVHLVGEGFFKVVKDSKRPFYVYGGAVVTKVLGTSFSVNASRNAKSIEVAVRTGKVSVYEGVAENTFTQHGSEGSGVILTPNEKVEYFIDDKHWVTTLVAKPKPLPESNKEVEFVFNDAPMSEIIKSIERTYSIGVVIENDAPYSCTFTGDVSMMELYDLLDVICKSTGTNYEVKGTKILITGKGCQ